MKKSFNKLKLAIILFITITILIIIIFIITLILSIRPKIKITNLSDYTSKEESRNKEKEQHIEERLYMTAKLNTETINSDVSAIVRDDSFKQYLKNNIYHVEFIADIEKLQQSYKITYAWGINADTEESEWDTNVLCPQKEELIYGDFNCVDSMIKAYGTNDPIILKLPVHSVDEYYMYYDKEKESIIIDLYGCRVEVMDAQINSAIKWLKDNVDNYEKYSISYNYCASRY